MKHSNQIIGKSSLFLLLFRVVPPSTGSIKIDGKNINDLGLLTLRKIMTIIPQEPLLMNGSVRTNLDPFREHDDKDLINVLKKVQLDLALEYEIGSHMTDSALSVGQSNK